MKRALIFVLALVLACMLAQVCCATTVDAEMELESYIKEKIVPVVVGVLTAVIALITTLGSVAKSLNELKDTKTTFKSEAQERASSFEKSVKLLDEQAKKIETAINNIPEMREKISQLNEECKAIARIVSLGFSSNEDVVRSGKGHEMAVLVENLDLQERKK